MSLADMISYDYMECAKWSPWWVPFLRRLGTIWTDSQGESSTHGPLPETNSSPFTPENGPIPKGNDRIPTIQFNKNVSFQEGINPIP